MPPKRTHGPIPNLAAVEQMLAARNIDYDFEPNVVSPRSATLR